MRDKKRFVLKTFSHLKSINLFYLGTSSKDEITELHRWTETSQIPKKHESGYFHSWGWNGTPSVASCPVPPHQGHDFCVTLGASLAGGVSALALATTPETWCKKEWGRFGGVLWDAWPSSVSYPHVTSCQALSWFVIRSQMGFAKLILLDRPLKSLNNYSRKRKMVWLWLGLQGYVLLQVAGMVTGNWIYLEIKLMPRRKSPPVKFTAVVLPFRSAEDTPVAQPPYRSRGQFKAIVLILQSPERFLW